MFTGKSIDMINKKPEKNKATNQMASCARYEEFQWEVITGMGKDLTVCWKKKVVLETK
jgi:hypothetical protein